jgi:hypothetical protein
MGGGGPTYNAPPVQKDDSFEKYLAYQQQKEKSDEERIATEKAETKAEAAARKAAGAAGYAGLKSGVESQMRQGLLGYETATQQLRDYASKYDMTPPETDVASLTDIYTKELLPGRRQTGIKAAYEETLGRQATEEELNKATERFNQGFYTTNQDLVSSLSKGSEYQEKFDKSYLDSYYTTMFGSQTTDAAGKKTGKRTFTFDKNLLPEYGGDLASKTKIKTPDFGSSFTGTPAEIEEQQANVRDTRQYLYSAGLTNLQGEIDANTQKIKNQGAKEQQKIQSFGNVASSLVSGFWG